MHDYAAYVIIGLGVFVFISFRIGDYLKKKGII